MNLRQFFNLLRQQRLFSGIYITSTALSTALTMTLFLVLYIMLGPVYPEQERSRMAVVKLVRYAKEETGGYRINGASMALADSLRNMPEVEWLTAIRSAIDGAVIGSEGEHIPCMTQPVDDAYWHVFNFRFIHGRSFSREECEAQAPYASSVREWPAGCSGMPIWRAACRMRKTLTSLSVSPMIPGCAWWASWRM